MMKKEKYVLPEAREFCFRVYGNVLTSSNAGTEDFSHNSDGDLGEDDWN